MNNLILKITDLYADYNSNKITLGELHDGVEGLIEGYGREARIDELKKIKQDAKEYGYWTESTKGGIEMEVDDRMKPTDIWTNNFYWEPRPICKNGMPCHVAAPRGSKTGTQGRKGSFLRSQIPPELCREVLIPHQLTERNLDE